ncbi:MAG: sensor histidine kinase, partial [Burkholderiales bacterium]
PSTVLPVESWPAWAVLILAVLGLVVVLLMLLLVLLLWRTRNPAPQLASSRNALLTPTVEKTTAAEPRNPSPPPNAPQGTAQDRDSEQDAFSYTVSHDLRAPIRVVEGFTKILKEDYGAQLDRIGNDHLDRVLGAASRMNQMIDALLALSQLSRQPLGHQRVDLSQLAHYIAEDLRREQPDRAVTFHIAQGLTTQGDPTLLRVVLENLLGNAWKYSSKREHAEIWFTAHENQAHTYTVRDNGAGFDMRFADRLFGVFQRLHSASDFAGTGVGLASVKRIVQRHGGDIWAQAEVGQGAAFHFSLHPQGGSYAR